MNQMFIEFDNTRLCHEAVILLAAQHLIAGVDYEYRTIIWRNSGDVALPSLFGDFMVFEDADTFTLAKLTL